jgi:hypothetical protein
MCASVSHLIKTQDTWKALHSMFMSRFIITMYTETYREPGQLSRYSDGLRAGQPQFDYQQRQDFSLLHSALTGSEAHVPSIQWVPGAISPGVKWPGSEAHHSPPSSVEVKTGAIPLLYIFTEA